MLTKIPGGKLKIAVDYKLNITTHLIFPFYHSSVLTKIPGGKLKIAVDYKLNGDVLRSFPAW